jgi:hypothetical protein
MSSDPFANRKQKLQLLKEELKRLHTERLNTDSDQFYKTEQLQSGIRASLIAIEREYDKAEGRREQKQLEQQYLYHKSLLENPL